MTSRKLDTLSDLVPVSEVRRNPYGIETEHDIESLCCKFAILQLNFNEYTDISPYMDPVVSCKRPIASTVLFNTLLFIDDRYEQVDRTEMSDACAAQTQKVVSEKFQNSAHMRDTLIVDLHLQIPGKRYRLPSSLFHKVKPHLSA